MVKFSHNYLLLILVYSRGATAWKSQCLLLRNVDPVAGSSHHSLSIDGSKAKVEADSQASCIGHPVISSQYVRVGGVGYQVLHVSPRQIRTV